MAWDGPSPGNPRAESNGTFTFDVDIQKAPGARLGMEAVFVSSPNGFGLVVERVNVGGALEAWNRRSREPMRVKPGDLVVGVNGIEGDISSLAEELRSGRAVKMTVQRSPDDESKQWTKLQTAAAASNKRSSGLQGSLQVSLDQIGPPPPLNASAGSGTGPGSTALSRAGAMAPYLSMGGMLGDASARAQQQQWFLAKAQAQAQYAQVQSHWGGSGPSPDGLGESSSSGPGRPPPPLGLLPQTALGAGSKKGGPNPGNMPSSMPGDGGVLENHRGSIGQEFSFDVVLVKPEGSKLGIDIQQANLPEGSQLPGLRVKHISPGGVVESWNQRSEPAYKIRTGDRIVRVNNIIDYATMMKELRTGRELHVTIVRSDVSAGALSGYPAVGASAGAGRGSTAGQYRHALADSIHAKASSSPAISLPGPGPQTALANVNRRNGGGATGESASARAATGQWSGFGAHTAPGSHQLSNVNSMGNASSLQNNNLREVVEASNEAEGSSGTISFDVCLEPYKGKRVGIDVILMSANGVCGFVIERITEGGRMDMWNRTRQAPYKVLPGDHIVEVNDISTSNNLHKISEEFSKPNEQLRLKVQRSPRQISPDILTISEAKSKMLPRQAKPKPMAKADEAQQLRAAAPAKPPAPAMGLLGGPRPKDAPGLSSPGPGGPPPSTSLASLVGAAPLPLPAGLPELDEVREQAAEELPPPPGLPPPEAPGRTTLGKATGDSMVEELLLPPPELPPPCPPPASFSSNLASMEPDQPPASVLGQPQQKAPSSMLQGILEPPGPPPGLPLLPESGVLSPHSAAAPMLGGPPAAELPNLSPIGSPAVKAVAPPAPPLPPPPPPPSLAAPPPPPASKKQAFAPAPKLPGWQGPTNKAPSQPAPKAKSAPKDDLVDPMVMQMWSKVSELNATDLTRLLGSALGQRHHLKPPVVEALERTSGHESAHAGNGET